MAQRWLLLQELQSCESSPASLWAGTARDRNCPGVCEERKVRKQPGKVVKCAGGSFLTKDVKRPSSRTCPDGGEVKGGKPQGSE